MASRSSRWLLYSAGYFSTSWQMTITIIPKWGAIQFESNMGGSKNWGYQEIIQFHRIFPYQPSSLGYLHLWIPLYQPISIYIQYDPMNHKGLPCAWRSHLLLRSFFESHFSSNGSAGEPLSMRINHWILMALHGGQHMTTLHIFDQLSNRCKEQVFDIGCVAFGWDSLILLLSSDKVI